LLSINKDSGRPIDAKRRTTILIGRNAPGDFLAIHVCFESVDIQPKLGRVVIQEWADICRGGPEGAIFIKRVVHLPKPALQSGGLGRSRRIKGVAMLR
jgi:hypothetical protein